MKKYEYILLFILIFFLIFISSCNFNDNKPNEETKEDDKKEDIFKPSDYKDEAGYIRDKEGIYSENIILNKTNYEKYKNELIGDSGESGLINKNLLNLDKKINESDYNYFICYFYAYWRGSINLKNYFKVNLINENEVLFDTDAILVDELVINNYKVENKENYNPNVSFDFSKDPFERLSIKVYGSILLKDYNNTFFTIVMPFKIKEKGNLNIDFSINEDKLDYSYHKENNLIIGDYSDGNSNLKINDYKISFISELLCQNGEIDDSKLTTNPKFVTNIAKYLIVDLDTTTLNDNTGNDKLNIFLYSSNPNDLESTIEDVPTSDISEKTIDNKKEIRTSISISREKDVNKKYRLIFKLLPKTSDDNDVFIFLAGNSISISEYKNNNFTIRASNSGLNISNGVVQGVIDNTITEVSIPKLYKGKEVKIGKNAFADCKDLYAVVIEDGVKEIGENAFLNCESLSYIKLPDSIKNIASNAFDGCNDSLFYEYENCNYVGNELNNYLILLKPKDDKLENLKLNFNAKIIASSAFKDYSSLKEATLYGINYIGDYAFYNCSNLSEFKCPIELEEIGKEAFSYSHIEKLTINQNLKIIDDDAFDSCGYLKKVYYDGTIKDWCNIDFLGYYSTPMYYETEFYLKKDNNYNLLTKIDIPEDVTEIKKYTFKGFYNVTEINIPNTITSIGTFAFEGCENLKQLTIPNSVTNIDSDILALCINLEELSLPFLGRNNESVLPFGYTFGTYYFMDKNKYDKAYSVRQEYVNSENKKISDTYYLPISLKKISITNATNIPNGGFINCSYLEEVNLFGNINKIGKEALENCINLKIINISSDAKEIGDYCFKNCEKLENINLPNFELLSNGLFENCYSLKNIIIPNSVKIIKGAFFLNCTSLERIILSKNITSIGGGFVNGCESLEAIYYEGSIEQWNEIEKLIDDSWVENVTIIYNYSNS